ncbi:MAG TPA: ribonuclease domain-containing protein [bacterium]|nr:ribonuclease domain-containing protein [bacterium]
MKKLIPFVVPLLFALMLIQDGAAIDHRPSCREAVHALNLQLAEPINEVELVAVLTSLNASDNARLPENFTTKAHARKLGWRPGQPLWKYQKLKGKSIGGDRFYDREKKLPAGRRVWREADLDYQGGRRNAKRLLYSNDGLSYVTVDHYQTFTEVPSCR